MLAPTDLFLCQHLTHLFASDFVTEIFKELPSEMTHSETMKKKCISEANLYTSLKSSESRHKLIDASNEPLISP